VQVPFNQSQSFSDATIDHLTPADYHALFQHDFEQLQAQGLISSDVFAPIYLGFQDSLQSIDTVSDESVILHVPHKEYMHALNAFSKDDKRIERILFQTMPGLSLLTSNYVTKLISLFNEFTYIRGQRIVEEKDSSNYIYYIAEGEVRLTNKSNPFARIEAAKNRDSTLAETCAIIS